MKSRLNIGHGARRIQAGGLLLGGWCLVAGLLAIEANAIAADPAAKNAATARQPTENRRAAAKTRAETQQRQQGTTKQPSRKQGRGKKAAGRTMGQPALSPATEQAARAFAAEHHAELIPLLDRLRRSRPRQYRQAMFELARTSEKFARLRQSVPSRYDTSLRAWKLNSRIRLLAARMSMSDDAGQAEELRELLRERLDVRRQELLVEQERLTRRLGQVQQLLDRLDGDPEEMVEREFGRVQRVLLHRGRPAGRSGAGKRQPGRSPVVAPRPPSRPR